MARDVFPKSDTETYFAEASVKCAEEMLRPSKLFCI